MLTNSKINEVLENCHKNKIRTNEPKLWQNNKNTEPQPKLFGSYNKTKKKSVIGFNNLKLLKICG